MASNIVKRTGPNDDWAPDKKNSHGKIDGIVSALIAYSRAIHHVKKQGSIYDRMAL
jgi:phage terminase large subunit-like protein